MQILHTVDLYQQWSGDWDTGRNRTREEPSDLLGPLPHLPQAAGKQFKVRAYIPRAWLFSWKATG